MKNELTIVLAIIAVIAISGTIVALYQEQPTKSEQIIEQIPAVVDDFVDNEIIVSQIEYDSLTDAALADCEELFADDPDYIATCFLKVVHALDDEITIESNNQDFIDRVEKMQKECGIIYHDPELIASCEAAANMIILGLEMPIEPGI